MTKPDAPVSTPLSNASDEAGQTETDQLAQGDAPRHGERPVLEAAPGIPLDARTDWFERMGNQRGIDEPTETEALPAP
nr:hypothetical protein [Chloroflexota bacterium]